MIPIVIRLQISPPPTATVRQLRTITREAHRVQAWTWHHRFIALHFQPSARFRYGYKSRTSRFRRYKAKLGKGDVDLVFSGLTATAMQRPPRVRAFPSRARVDMAGPSYVKMRPRNANRPNMAHEITATTHDEVVVLESILGNEVTTRLKTIPGSLKQTCGP